MRTIARYGSRVGLGICVGICVGSALGACGGGGGGDGGPDAAPPDAFVPPDAAIPDAEPIPDAAQNPESLRETGLYSDFENEVLAPGVREFEPRFELWSDGAAKRRFLYLPPGSQIDTSNMDYWEYPVGTRLWKEFWRDGVRLETRLLYKIRAGAGERSWRMVPFAWNAEQTEADARLGGAQDALDTEHDIPPLSECLGCHGNMHDVVLGVSAVMLDHDGEGLTLGDLIAEGKLSSPPVGSGSPYFPLPGDATAQAALGYMHSNCGSCHNPTSEVPGTGDALQNLRLETPTLATVEGSPPFLTTVCQEEQSDLPAADQIIVPGDPEASSLFLRMSQRGNDEQMPKLATELVDDTGLAAVRAWIESLDACP